MEEVFVLEVMQLSTWGACGWEPVPCRMGREAQLDLTFGSPPWTGLTLMKLIQFCDSSPDCSMREAL